MQSIGKLLLKYTSISIAFTYQSEEELLKASSQIESLKKIYNDRINFLRPTISVDGKLRVTIEKIIDNAVCDTVRVKYIPKNISGQIRLCNEEKHFFQEASSLYKQLHLYHRSSSDGYFAIRVGEKDSFLITATKTDKERISFDRIVKVIKYEKEKNILWYEGGKLPSSDAVEASIIFQRCSTIGAIIHTHASSLFTRNIKYKHKIKVGVYPYGESKLGYKISKAITENSPDFLIMEEHGEVFWSKKEETTKLFEFIKKSYSESLLNTEY